MEVFNEDLEHLSQKKAKRRLTLNALRFIHPEIFMRNKFRFIHHIMLRHHVKISLRNLAKGKYYSLINIMGLA